MLTITDKLFLAQAYNLHKNNETMLRLYLASRCPHLCAAEHKSYYTTLCIESSKNGYSDVLEFCYDRRFLLLRGLKVNYVVAECKEEVEVREFEYKRTKIETKEEVIEVKKVPITPTQIYLRSKPPKRLLLRMSDDEIKFEEKFNGVEELFQVSNISCVPPKNDDYQETEIMSIEPLKMHVREVLRPFGVVDQLSQVLQTANTNKKNTRDKSQWPNDLRTMNKIFFSFLKQKKISISFIDEARSIAEGRIEGTLPLNVIKIMILIQRIIFEMDGYNERREMHDIKCKYGALYDLYRRG